MPSNSLSSRRGLLRRPIVCSKPPPPSPPAPPPPPWPPDSFEIHFAGHYQYFPPGIDLDFARTLTRSPLSWDWIWLEPGSPDYRSLTWEIDDLAHTAKLHVFGSVSSLPFSYTEPGIPANWGTPATYVINSWSTVSPPGATGQADFTF